MTMRFVLLDELTELEPGRSARARMAFPVDSEIFADHFPGMAIVPGVLVTEAMAQTAGWLLAATCGFERWPILIMIREAKFRRLVPPGQELQLQATMRRGDDCVSEIDAQATAGAERVASARLVFRALQQDLAPAARERLSQWARETFERLGGPAALERRRSARA